MSKNIQFLGGEIDFDHSRKCATVPALVDGKRVVCIVSDRLLMERFRAASDNIGDLKKAYYAGEHAIQETSRELIEAGEITDKAEVLITSETFR